MLPLVEISVPHLYFGASVDITEAILQINKMKIHTSTCTEYGVRSYCIIYILCTSSQGNMHVSQDHAVFTIQFAVQLAHGTVTVKVVLLLGACTWGQNIAPRRASVGTGLEPARRNSSRFRIYRLNHSAIRPYKS